MRLVRLILILLILAGVAPGAGAAELSIHFSKMPAGGSPNGFRSALTGDGKLGEWRIIEAEGPTGLPAVTDRAPAPKQNVLAQQSRDGTETRYPLLIMEEKEFGDFTLTTRFKLVEGVVEQMAGIAFRIQDENNYYYIRASGLYNTIAFIPVFKGQITKPIRVEVPIAKGAWHELKIKAEGTHFTAWLNGKEVLTATASVFATGKVGFWTKSDSVSYFTDTHIHYRPLESLAATLARETLEKYRSIQNIRIVGWKGGREAQVVASSRPEELGTPANDVELDVLTAGKKYFGRGDSRKFVIVTLPLADRNGETIAAVRLEMNTFKGQTDVNAIARATPLIAEMEGRVARAPDVTGF